MIMKIRLPAISRCMGAPVSLYASLLFCMAMYVLGIRAVAQETKPNAPVSTWRRSVQPTRRAADTPRLHILGAYHMGNPGQDQFNVVADDVLSPKRQNEIEELRDRLAAYQATKIAVEGDFHTQASLRKIPRRPTAAWAQ